MNLLMPLQSRTGSTAEPTRFRPAGAAADLSIVIVNYNTRHLLGRCVEHLRAAAAGLRTQLIIVDNASRDGSAAWIREQLPDAILIDNASNVGFGRANNQALPLASGRCVLLLNADAYLYPDTLRAVLAYLDSHPECGVLGVRSVDESGAELFTGRRFPDPRAEFSLRTGLFSRYTAPADRAQTDGAVDCDWVVGCCYAVRQEVLQRIGLFDPRYFLYFEEVDHCQAVWRAGWHVRCLLEARVIHVGGGSAATEGALSQARQISAYQTESALLYFRKQAGRRGLLQWLGLTLAAEAVVALKALLRRRWAVLSGGGRYCAELLRLLVATRAGTRPTR